MWARLRRTIWLIAERDGLSRKRDFLRDELRRVQAEIAMIKKRRKSR
jgi:hypothetical protein